MKYKVGDRVWVNSQCYIGEITAIHDNLYLDVDNVFVCITDLHDTAQSMFEALGYLDQGGDELHNERLNKNIYFDADKTVSCYSYHSKTPTVKNESMTIDELKASYQMCIEKGWL